MNNPRVTDDDKGEITVTLDDRELRGWSYKDDTERRVKMLFAREYVEGWCDNDGSSNIKNSIDTRLNNYLCKMKPGYDDSIVGFNEAWDVVRETFLITNNSEASMTPKTTRSNVGARQVTEILDRLFDRVAFGDAVYQFHGTIEQAQAHIIADHLIGWLCGDEEIPE